MPDTARLGRVEADTVILDPRLQDIAIKAQRDAHVLG